MSQDARGGALSRPQGLRRYFPLPLPKAVKTDTAAVKKTAAKKADGAEKKVKKETAAVKKAVKTQPKKK